MKTKNFKSNYKQQFVAKLNQTNTELLNYISHHKATYSIKLQITDETCHINLVCTIYFSDKTEEVWEMCEGQNKWHYCYKVI